MAVAFIDGWYNFQDDDYNLYVQIRNDNYDTSEELEDAIADESASEMFYYEPNSGFHLKSKYVVTVQKYDEVLDKYIDVDKSDWEYIL